MSSTAPQSLLFHRRGVCGNAQVTAAFDKLEAPGPELLVDRIDNAIFHQRIFRPRFPHPGERFVFFLNRIISSFLSL